MKKFTVRFNLFILVPLVIAIFFILLTNPKPDAVAVSPGFPNAANPALTMDCNSVGREMVRCKNWEMVCMYTVVYTDPVHFIGAQMSAPACFALNLPKTKHMPGYGKKK